MSYFGVLLLSLVASFIVALLLVMTRRLHGHLTLDNHAGIQKLHTTPTPRIGGLAMAAGLVVGGFALPPEAGTLWWLICLAAVPAFLSGLIEDLTKRVGVRTRLLATICSGLLMCLLTGHALVRTDIPLLDMATQYWPVAVLITAFAIGGIANAVNIIDGVNGLASGTALIILAGFAVIAWQTDDMAIFGACLVAAGAVTGFFLLNYPWGLLFFGDAGAYTAGFLLATIGVLLPARNPELSPAMGLLALSYPVIETIISIHRRMVREGTNPGQPDRLHLHSLVHRSLSRRMARAIGAPGLRNPMAATVVWVIPALAMGLAILAAENSLAAWVGIAVVAFVYILIYRRVALLGWPTARQHDSGERPQAG